MYITFCRVFSYNWLWIPSGSKYHQPHLQGRLPCYKLYMSTSLQQLGCEATQLACCYGGYRTSSVCDFESGIDSTVLGGVCSQKKGLVRP